MKKHLYLNYLYEFILNFRITSLLWPTFLVIKGFSLLDVGICESVYHITSLLGEMPTGIVSDLYGRRFSRLIGRILEIISVICLISAQSEWMIYASFMLSALSNTMESGTDTAYVYDLLLEEQKQEEFAKVQGRREVVIQTAILLATTIGGIMAGFSYELTYGSSVLIMMLSIIVLLQMKEIKNQDYVKTNIIKDMILQVTQSYDLIKKDHQIFYLMLSTSLFSATLTTCYFYLTTYWSGLGVSISAISIFLAIEHIVAMLAGIITHRIIRKTSQRKLLLILPLGIVISMLGIPFYPISIIAICVMAFFETILYIAMTSFLNEKVASQFRATLLSTLSLGFSAVMILYFPFVGWIGELFGLKTAYLCLFVLMLFIYLLYQHIIRSKFESQ